MQNNPKTLSIPPAHELEKIAQRASTTVPTVRNYLRGGAGKPRIAARVKAALLELGFADVQSGGSAAQAASGPGGE